MRMCRRCQGLPSGVPANACICGVGIGGGKHVAGVQVGVAIAQKTLVASLCPMIGAAFRLALHGEFFI